MIKTDKILNLARLLSQLVEYLLPSTTCPLVLERSQQIIFSHYLSKQRGANNYVGYHDKLGGESVVMQGRE